MPAPCATCGRFLAICACIGAYTPPRKTRRRFGQPPTPTLNYLIVAGLVKWDKEEHQYMAHASDGRWVMVGHDPPSAEKYLSAQPKPEDW